jgi:hypothetical protein
MSGIKDNDVTGFRQALGMHPDGLPRVGNRINVKAKFMYRTDWVKVPDKKTKKMKKVPLEVLSYTRYTTMGKFTVNVLDGFLMNEGQWHSCLVVAVMPLTALHPTVHVRML